MLDSNKVIKAIATLTGTVAMEDKATIPFNDGEYTAGYNFAQNNIYSIDNWELSLDNLTPSVSMGMLSYLRDILNKSFIGRPKKLAKLGYKEGMNYEINSNIFCDHYWVGYSAAVREILLNRATNYSPINPRFGEEDLKDAGLSDGFGGFSPEEYYIIENDSYWNSYINGFRQYLFRQFGVRLSIEEALAKH